MAKLCRKVWGPAPFLMPAFLQAFLPALVLYFVFAAFEEFGWRGYLAPKMYSLGWNVFLAHALVAVIVIFVSRRKPA